jgi:hypothetical protein
MKKLNHIAAVFWVIVFGILPGCATYRHSAESIEAWVVDADTNQPLEGVIVTANWQIEIGSISGHGCCPEQLMIMETVTGKNGRFYFPAWGPKAVKTRSPMPGLSEAYLGMDDPLILLFKNGYKYEALTNKHAVSKFEYWNLPVRQSDWNGKTVKMKKFRGTLKEYAQQLSFLRTDLGFAYNGQKCEWKLVPRMLVEQHKLKHFFREQNIYSSLLTIDDVPRQDKCGSAQEFFKDLLK